VCPDWRPQGRLISDQLFEVAHRDPGRELAVDPTSGRFSYSDVASQVERLVFGFRELGLGADDIVLLQLPNWLAFMVFHIALTAVGAISVNVPPGYREKEVGNILQVTKAKGLVVPESFQGYNYLALAGTLRSAHQNLHHVFVVGRGAPVPAEMISYQELISQHGEIPRNRGELAAFKPKPNALTVLSFTSGTTGAQKGAMLSSENLRAWNLGLAERYGLNRGERIFACSPIGHAVGFGHGLRMTLTLGASIVLLDRWDPARAIALIAEERCTFMAGATPFLMDLVNHPAVADYGNLPSLRLFLCGGASIPEQLMQDARETLPHTFVSPLWGMTECGGVTTCPFDAPAEKLHTTDGLACADMELKVVDPDGQKLPPGRDGELLVRGPMVAAGYYHLPEVTAESFLADGFFHTGDQARIDQDGYIKITGRIKDLIIRGGVNISPVEIENVLFSHPRIANVAVVGMPDRRLGERVCAFVVLTRGESLELDEVQRWMAQAGVTKTKWPQRVEVVTELPITPSGKVKKFRLREMLVGAE